MIKNKDIQLLREVHLIQMDIVSLEQRAEWERARMDAMTQNLSAASGGGVRRGMDDTFAAIEELEERHRMLVKQYTRVVKEAERIINGISSHQMRTLVTMLYLDNVPGSAVQSVLHMSRWAFENARSAIESAENMACVKWSDRYCSEK